MSDKDTHTYLEVNGDFRMRELDHNDLEQFNALLQYAFQVTSYELFQTGWEQEEINMPNVRFSRTLMYSVGFIKKSWHP